MLIRRVAAGIVIACLVVAAVAVAMPYAISTNTVKEGLATQVHELTGYRISYLDDPRLSLRPFLGLKLTDVTLRDEAGPDEEPELLQAEGLNARLEVLPLLFGRIRITDFRLVRPQFHLILRADGSANWRFPGGRIVETLRLAGGDAEQIDAAQRVVLDDGPIPSLGRLEVVDGIIDFENQKTGEREQVTNVNGAIAWPNINSSLQIAGACIWRGEEVRLDAAITDPLPVLAGGVSQLSLAVTSAPMSARFDGTAAMVSGLHVEGEASVETPSLRRMIRFFGGPQDQAPASGALVVRGMVSANEQEIRFTDSTVSIGESQSSGLVQLSRQGDGRLVVSGTLAFDTLDLTPYLRSLAAGRETGGENGPRAELGLPGGFDLDVRLSAEQAVLGETLVSGLAAASTLRDEVFKLDVGEASMFGGTVSGKFEAMVADGGLAMSADAKLTGVDMGTLSRTWYTGEIFPEGIGDIDLKLKSGGNAFATVVDELSGNLRLSIANGKISGVDLDKAAAALEDKSVPVTIGALAGETAFDQLELELSIFRGVAWILKGETVGPANRVRLFGKADLYRGGLAINADIDPATPADGTDAAPARIFFGGTIRTPLVTRAPVPALGRN